LRRIDAQPGRSHRAGANVTRTTRTMTAVAGSAMTTVTAMTSPVPAVITLEPLGELDVEFRHLLESGGTTDIALGRV